MSCSSKSKYQRLLYEWSSIAHATASIMLSYFVLIMFPPPKKIIYQACSTRLPRCPCSHGTSSNVISCSFSTLEGSLGKVFRFIVIGNFGRLSLLFSVGFFTHIMEYKCFLKRAKLKVFQFPPQTQQFVAYAFQGVDQFGAAGYAFAVLLQNLSGSRELHAPNLY